MTVVAAIEIGTSGTLTPSPGRTNGAASGALQEGRATLGFSPSASQATQSFRSGWQSLLASMGDGQAASSQTGSSVKGSALDSHTLKANNLSSFNPPEAEADQQKLSAGQAPSSVVAPAVSFKTRPIVVAAASSSVLPSTKSISSKASTKSEESKPAAVGDKTTTQSAPAQTTQVVHDLASSEAVQAAAVQVPLPAVATSLLQSAPAVVIASSVARSTNAQTQPAEADLYAALPTGSPTGISASSFTPPSLQHDAPDQISSGEVLEAAKIATPVLYQNQAPGERLSQTPATVVASRQSTTSALPQSQREIPAQPTSQGAAAIPAGTASAEMKEMNSLPAATNAVVFQPGQPSTGAPIESTIGVASGGKASALGKLRSAHGVGTVDSAQQASRIAEGQPAALPADASALMRDQTSAPKTVSTPGVSSALATGPDSREVFATLDAGDGLGRPAWIHAGAQRAEVGFQDPALGWVGVRADSSSGGVRAELVAGSADAAQALSSHMAGLNAYLAERHTPVESLTMATPQGGSPGAGSDRGAGEGMQQGAGQQTGQGADTGSASGPLTERSAAAEISAPSVWQEGSAQAATPGSVHISVMA